jgi:hypothetical protein
VRQEGPHEDQSGEALEEMIAKLIAEIEGSGELEQSERNTETKIKDRNMTAKRRSGRSGGQKYGSSEERYGIRKAEIGIEHSR